jgi:hypothetical protein
MSRKQSKRKGTARTYHRVDDVLELHHDDPLNRNSDLLAEIASSDGVANPSDILNLSLEQPELFNCTHTAFKRSSGQWSRRYDEWAAIRRNVKVCSNLGHGHDIRDRSAACGTIGTLEMRCGRRGGGDVIAVAVVAAAAIAVLT